jgi:hypothetical protein
MKTYLYVITIEQENKIKLLLVLILLCKQWGSSADIFKEQQLALPVEMWLRDQGFWG